MTIKDKFLKDDVDIQELAQELEQAVYERTGDNLSKVFIDYFNKKIPKLTEDERVILRNIKGQPKYISRQKDYSLMAYDKAERASKTGWRYDNGRMMSSFSHLFQFIKNGEEYEIKELLANG